MKHAFFGIKGQNLLVIIQKPEIPLSHFVTTKRDLKNGKPKELNMQDLSPEEDIYEP